MKSQLFVLLALFCLPTVILAQKGAIESCTPAAPVVVDGIADEWQAEWITGQKSKFFYNICNDADNLYVRLKITDEMTQRKIGLFGLSLLLNPKGKKAGKLGIKYPIEKNMDELSKQVPTGPQNAATIQQMKNDLIKDEQVLELVGLSKENITSNRLGLMNGIQVFIKAGDFGEWIYEAKIPFAAYHIKKSEVKVLGVAFVTGKLVVKNTNTNTGPVGGGAGNMGYANRYGMGMGYGGGGANFGPAFTEWNIATSLAVTAKLK